MTNIANDFEAFFDKTEDYVITSRFYECDQSFTVEELYQAFKERLISEMKSDNE